MKQWFLVFTLILATCTTVYGQSNSEKKKYRKALDAATVEAYDKFINKYPKSVFVQDLLMRKDTLLNISPYSIEDARNITSCENAVPVRIQGEDRIYVLEDSDSRLALIMLKGENWQDSTITSFFPYSMEAAVKSRRLAGNFELLEENGRKRIWFDYLNTAESSLEYVATMYDITDDNQQDVLFYGSRGFINEDSYQIEGQSPDSMDGSTMTAERVFLLNRMNENPSLVTVSKADMLTDNAIEWWLSRNPNALTSAKTVSAGTVDPESSLVDMFTKSKDKEESSQFRAAFFDIRDYTVVVAYSKSSKSYMLVWVEPVCRNKNTDKYLNTIYFEKDNSTLDLFYYKGRTTQKIKVNLSSKKITR